MTMDAAAFEVTDALGADFIYLQPPGEQRFDPVTVAVGVGAAIVTLVAQAIVAGISDAVKSETKSIVTPAVQAIARRARQYLRRPFDAAERDTTALRTRLDEARIESDAARHALRGLPASNLESLPGAMAAAIRASLAEQGVPATAAIRVEVVVRAQVELLIEGTNATPAGPADTSRRPASGAADPIA
jgi:hypothetical protein